MSWHLDKKGKSFISHLLELTDKFAIKIVTESGYNVVINESDKVIVGDGTILISRYVEDRRKVSLINTNKIERIVMVTEQKDLNNPKIIPNTDKH